MDHFWRAQDGVNTSDLALLDLSVSFNPINHNLLLDQVQVGSWGEAPICSNSPSSSVTHSRQIGALGPSVEARMPIQATVEGGGT